MLSVLTDARKKRWLIVADIAYRGMKRFHFLPSAD